MRTRLKPLSIILLALASPTMAQDIPVAPAIEVAPRTVVRVALETTSGTIVLALEADRAPATTANFLKYVDMRRFDGTAFYRAMKLGPESGLVQAGTRYDAKRILPPVKHEPTSETGLSHVAGTVSMARFEPGSATGDFFILVSAMPSLDANPQGTGDNSGFAAFGQVTEGMDIVRQILSAPTSPTEGEGFLKGQMIEAPVTITRAYRVK